MSIQFFFELLIIQTVHMYTGVFPTRLDVFSIGKWDLGH